MKNIVLLICVIINFNVRSQEIVYMNQWNQLPDDTGKYFADLDNNYENFIGTWEYQNGNQTFQIILSKITQSPFYTGESPKFYADIILGHYKMILNKNLPNESILYNSDKKIGLTNEDWPNVIRGMTLDGIILGGSVHDNSGILTNEYPTGVRGNLIMTINSGTNPSTATWKVILPQGIYGNNQPKTFTIPTDVVLTKVN